MSKCLYIEHNESNKDSLRPTKLIMNGTGGSFKVFYAKRYYRKYNPFFFYAIIYFLSLSSSYKYKLYETIS